MIQDLDLGDCPGLFMGPKVSLYKERQAGQSPHEGDGVTHGECVVEDRDFPKTGKWRVFGSWKNKQTDLVSEPPE